MLINNEKKNEILFNLQNLIDNKNILKNIKKNTIINNEIEKNNYNKKIYKLKKIINNENKYNIKKISSPLINIQTIIQIRNQLIEAYQEIMNIQI